MDRRQFIFWSLGAGLAAGSQDVWAGETSDLDLQAQAALAVHMHMSAKRKLSAPAAAPVAEPSQPIVYVYKAPFKCPPCDAAEKALKNKNNLELYFEFDRLPKLVYQPEAFPHFYWQTQDGKWANHSGWTTLDSFMATYRQKIEVPKAKAMAREPELDQYYPGWTWPGVLAQHLSSFHRINIAGMTQDQMEMTHDRIHESTRQRWRR